MKDRLLLAWRGQDRPPGEKKLMLKSIHMGKGHAQSGAEVKRRPLC